MNDQDVRFKLVFGEGGKLVHAEKPNGDRFEPEPAGTAITGWEGMDIIPLIHADVPGHSHCCWIVIGGRLYCLPCH